MDPTPVLLFIAVIAPAGLGWATIVSAREREPRAAWICAAGAVGLAAVYLLAHRFAPAALAWLLVALPAAAVLLWLLPVRGPRHPPAEARDRIDERTVMFARMTLKPGTERFDAHYREFPEHRDPDDRWRERPGLLSPDARHHHGRLFDAAAAAYATIDALQPLVDGEPEPRTGDEDPAELTRFLHGWLRKTGAVSTGVTELRDAHWYTVTGRRPPYGAPAKLPHTHALVFTVEMDKDLLDRAPRAPVIVETTRQYLNAAQLAVQAALVLRRRGYAARAHIDANYRVVCPLVARDAGLGEIGRMGLLMTPELGPRVRIGVVTTDAPLATDAPTRDETVLDFCAICEKCADVCPSAAIPRGPRAEIDGVARWRIDQEACFAYWCGVGTDCGRCMQVCPYSHPDNLLHRLVRSGVRRSALFRRLALPLDDLVYGRRPPTRDLEDWMGGP